MLTFVLGRLAPGDPVDTLLSGIQSPTVEEIEQAREYLGLNSSIPVQYVKWVSRVVHGDFGVSYKSGRDVLQEIALRLPATIQLAAGAGVVMLIYAFPLGIISSVCKNRTPDYVIQTINILTISIPSFCIGILLVSPQRIASVRRHQTVININFNWIMGCDVRSKSSNKQENRSDSNPQSHGFVVSTHLQLLPIRHKEKVIYSQNPPVN